VVSLVEGDLFVSVDLEALRIKLRLMGLHIVSAKDMAVLEASAAFPTEYVDGSHVPSLDDWQRCSEFSLAWERAELARRKP